jgi:hypothetical protein
MSIQGLLLTAPNIVEDIVGNPVSPSIRTTRKKEGNRGDDGGELHFENESNGCDERGF